MIHQDAFVFALILNEADHLEHWLEPERAAHVHVIRGRLTVNGTALAAGDALKASGENAVTLSQAAAAELLSFDLPPS